MELSKTAKSQVLSKPKSKAIYSLKNDWRLWVFVAPAVLCTIIFSYIPMGGLVMAFQDFTPGKGIFGSDFVGFKWFLEFFDSYHFGRLMKNTFVLSFLPLLFGFPFTIIFALALNEIRNRHLKKAVQFASYFPYFISTVVVVGMVVTFLSPNDGIINAIIRSMGGENISFLTIPSCFPWIYTVMMVWKTFGFNSILYLAALSSIDPAIYESAKIDGSTKFQEIWYITLPSIMPTVIIVLLLGLGNLMRTGFEEIFLLYNESVYSTADVINTFVYRQGIEMGRTSYATAVGLFNSVISFALLVSFNAISRKVSDISLW